MLVWGLAPRQRRRPTRAKASAAGLATGALALAIVARAGSCLFAGFAAGLAGSEDGRASSRAVRKAADGSASDAPGLVPQSGANSKPVAVESDGLQDEMSDAPDFAVWIKTRKKAAEILTAWAEEEEATEEMSAYLKELAAKEVPQDWGVWAIADAGGLETGGGFYMLEPLAPQAIVLLDPVDEDKTYVEYMAFNPKTLGPTPKKALSDWLESFRPKKQIIRRPEQLILWDMEVKGGKGSMAKVSKGV